MRPSLLQALSAINVRRLYQPVAEDVASPTGSPVGAEEIVALGATAAPHVSRPRQAPLGPRRFASILDFGVPIVGPGATVGTVETRVPRAGLPGPTTSSEKISLRTRLSKPGEALMPGEVSTRIPSRGDHAKGLARLRPREGFLLPKPALSPRQSAHGFCLYRRAADTPKRGDASAVVAILMYKAVNKAAPSKGEGTQANGS